MLKREDILGSAVKLRTEVLDVPEWDGQVTVREMTGTERDRLEADISQKKQTAMANLRARVVAMCCVDENGAALFTDADAAELGKLSAAALDRVFWAAMRLSRMNAGDVDALKENFT